MTDREIAKQCNASPQGDFVKHHDRRSKLGWKLLGVFVLATVGTMIFETIAR